jgi:tetratricopeptide (TPR) repeat protein
MRIKNWRSFHLILYAAAGFGGTACAWQSQLLEDERLSRIQQQILSGDLRSARAELETAIARLPRDPRLFNFLGVVEAQQKHFAAAELNFRRAIQIAPRFSDAYLNLGRLYQEHSDEPQAEVKAIAIYQKLLEYDPDHVAANYQAASLFIRRRAYAASLQHLSRLPPDQQQRPSALALRCAANMALGRAAQAETAATQLLASKDLIETDVLPIVPLLLENKSEELAVRLMEGLALRNLASGHTLKNLAGLYETSGEFKKAHNALEKCLEREQPSAALLSRIAQLSYRGGDLEDALAHLAHARDLEPKNAAVHFLFGLICVELKLPPEAKASLLQALRLDPDNPYFNYAYGAVLVSEKSADEAVSYFRKYRDARPGDPRGAFALGVAYFEGYQMDAARKELLSIANNRETRMGAQLYLGRLALAQEDMDEALVRFQNAKTANPKVPEPFADSALVRIRKGEYSLAEKDLAAALALSPDHYLSNLRLLMLYQRISDPRAEAQAERVKQLQKAGEEKERLLLRSLDIRPY